MVLWSNGLVVLWPWGLEKFCGLENIAQLCPGGLEEILEHLELVDKCISDLEKPLSLKL